MCSLRHGLLVVFLSVAAYFLAQTDAERLYQAPDLTVGASKQKATPPRDFVSITNLQSQNAPNQKLFGDNTKVQSQQQGINTQFIQGERGYSGTSTPWPQLGGKSVPNVATQNVPKTAGGRDWVNTNLNSQNVGSSSTNTMQSGATNVRGPTTGNNNQKMPNVPASGKRDWVNANSGGSTTPWPALGGNKAAPSQITPPQGPPNSVWNNRGAPQSPVKLDDVLKMPSYNPGWNNVPTTAKVSSTTKGPFPNKPGDSKEDVELREFSDGLLKKDVNNAAKYVTINYQGKTSSGSKDDKAPKPLLEVKPEALRGPTVSKLVQLHNNYILQTTESEHSTPQEKNEENAFLDALLSTSVMQAARNFLVEKGKVTKDPKDFRDLLKLIWFNMYARGGGKISSSGFEHVFLAEIKNRDVSGLHNWLYFNEQEGKHNANYLGFLKTLDLGNKGAIVKYHFTFANLDKPVGSMFIGTSPELEMALYSTCFVMRPDQACPVRLDGKDFTIRTYTYRYRGKNMIGSAFPEI